MSAPLPDALRARFQKLIEEGLSGRAAGLLLKLSAATGARWGLAIRRTGQAKAAPKETTRRLVYPPSACRLGPTGARCLH